MKRLKVIFLWHFHQPCYLDHATGGYRMPWVRLHGVRDYIGLPMLIGRHPEIRATVNVSPVLAMQLQDYVSRRAADEFLVLSYRPAADLSETDRIFILRNFFSLNPETAITPFPRFARLLEKRGGDLDPAALERRVREFTVGEMRDLQVWFNLAWFHPLIRREEATARDLAEKGRDFTEADKNSLLDFQYEVMARIIPLWRKMADGGQLEFSVSPSHHAILPLMLRHGGRLAEDARCQVREARVFHQSVFGREPRGCWPSEGAVCPETLGLLAEEGFRWAATDDEILRLSLDKKTFSRVDSCRAYAWGEGGREIGLLFRDHDLSDRLGFRYRYLETGAALDDFSAALETVREQAGAADPAVSIIMDGENAWEYYPAGGLPFLSELCRRLAGHPGLETVCAGDYLDAAEKKRLERIHAGSWISHDFHVWSGYPAADLAWDMLARARGDGPLSGMPPAARQAMLAAEGSDWAWWYSPEHSSGRDEEFDALFRRHITNVYRLRGEEEPPELQRPVAGGKDGVSFPKNPVTPVVDGRVTTYFEWLGAGRVGPGPFSGAMHGGEPLLQALYFGSDACNLYLRLDPHASGAFDAQMINFSLVFNPGGSWSFQLISGRISNGEKPFEAVFERVLEIAFPWRLLDLQPGGETLFHLEGDAGDDGTGRFPFQGGLRLVLPGPCFESEYW